MPLPKDCELRISFDRAEVSTSLLQITDGEELEELKINDCFAVTEWVSSPSLRSFFQEIENNPVAYNYDEIEMLTKPLPMGEKIIRLDNIRGGNIPSYIFLGIIPTGAVTGDFKQSSTNFECNKVTELNITLNGYSVNGYPINIRNESGTNVLFQFNETVGRTYNLRCGSGITRGKFPSNFIWAHRFEAEETFQGWIGVDMKLSEELSTSHTMIIWLISPMTVTIDKYHQVTRVTE